MTGRIGIAAIAGLLGAALPAAAQQPPYQGPYTMHYWDGGWGMMLFGPLFIILLVAALVALVVWVMRSGGGGLPQTGRSALDILKERYARGEIDKDEFEEKRRLLER